MGFKTRKWFFLVLLAISAVAFGYTLSLLIDNVNPSIAEYAIVVSFFLTCVMSFIEWISIRKKLGEI